MLVALIGAIAIIAHTHRNMPTQLVREGLPLLLILMGVKNSIHHVMPSAALSHCASPPSVAVLASRSIM